MTKQNFWKPFGKAGAQVRIWNTKNHNIAVVNDEWCDKDTM
jgi:hypothetical protein